MDDIAMMREALALAQAAADDGEVPVGCVIADGEGRVIYVGKAINLKNRVRSYFRTQPKEAVKTRALVRHIEDLEYIIVDNETEALVLECNLIKKYRPKYNISLKDGKTYPSICVTNEYFPRIFNTRNINKRYGTFFGPYSHISSMYAILEILKKVSEKDFNLCPVCGIGHLIRPSST